VNVLVTGITGAIGAALAPALVRAGHDVRGLSRRRGELNGEIPVLRGDVLTGKGLAAALDGVDVAYYLVHSMETAVDAGGGDFAARDRRAALAFIDAAQAAGVRRVIYLGGLVPSDREPSPHLASRLEVEEALLEAMPDSVALRASIVIGATSRSFRFLVRLIERMPVMPLPAWRENRTQPIDLRDVTALLTRAAVEPSVGGRSLDIAGPDRMTYAELIDRIAELMVVSRPPLRLGVSLTAVASVVAAEVAGEDHALIGPLMGSLETDLLPRSEEAAHLLGVRLHSFDSAVERALRDWEAREPLRAR
jgi:uncharacterized protein YbjT (DUF2867 family)